MSGEIGRNVTIGAGSVEFTENASIRGSLLAGAGNITLASPVGGNVKVGADNLTITNKIGGDVKAGVGMMRLTSKAKVNGSVTYWSDQTASIDDNALVSGDVVKKTSPDVPTPSLGSVFGGFAAFNIFTATIGFISTFVLGLLLIKFTPNFLKKTSDTLVKKTWASLSIGILALIFTPIIFVLLLISVLGFPLGLILISLYMISLYLSRIVVIFFVGDLILTRTGKKGHNILAFILGLIVYYIITLIPVIGGLATLLTVMFGLGVVLISKKEAYLEAKTKGII